MDKTAILQRVSIMWSVIGKQTTQGKKLYWLIQVVIILCLSCQSVKVKFLDSHHSMKWLHA